MDDYISRKAALESAWHNYYPSIDHYCTSVKCATRKDLEAIPAADVRPVVRARWYWDNCRYDWCCSNCSHPADHYIDKDDVYKKPSFKFCPHCGADMRETT